MATEQSLSVADGSPPFQAIDNQTATSLIIEAPSDPPATRHNRAHSSVSIDQSETFPNLPAESSSIALLQSPQLPETSAAIAPPRRGRARSSTLVGATNPLECPVSVEEQQLSNLVRSINRANQRTSSSIDLTRVAIPARAEPTVPSFTGGQGSEIFSELTTESEEKATNSTSSSCQSNTYEATKAELQAEVGSDYTFGNNTEPKDNRQFPPWEYLIQNRPSPRFADLEAFGYHLPRDELPTCGPELFNRIQKLASEMNSYQNYLDSPGAGPSPNPRAAPPSPSQGMNQNGMNGGMGLSGGMVGFPTPAGHQSDLNYIMQMVEELAGQLAHNQGLTAGIVDKMGKVRAKAKNQELSNDELLAIAASELNSKHVKLKLHESN